MKQISILASGRDGLTADITALLARRGVNIETLSAIEVKGNDVVTLTVDRYDAALDVLSAAGYEAFTEDALLVRVLDEPGALARLAVRFKEAGVSMRSIRILRRRNGWGIVAISSEQMDDARELVRDLMISEE